MSNHPNVAIFWDYENCNPPSSSCGLGYDIVNNISRIARLFGSVTTFRAYLDISAQSLRSVLLRSELQSSGVSMIDCPHNGRKDVVDKMILVDMLAFAVDHPAPATIFLITGDRDYAYAVSTLKLRKYQVVLVVPSSPHTSPSLESQASLVIDWGVAALRARTESANITQAVRQPYPELDADLVAKLLRELQDPSPDDPDAATHPYSTASPSTSKLRRISARDLLGPLRPYKNTGSFISMQEFTPNPASPKKPTSIGNDLASWELAIPTTPSRARSVSAPMGSARARSTTVIGQSPPPVGQDPPAENPPSSSAWRSSIFNVPDVVGPAEHSPPVMQSLDTLELPPHDGGPPSSIVVYSPLEPSQSMAESGRSTVPSSYKLDCLAAPFITTKVPTGSESLPSFHTTHSHIVTAPTSPIVPAAKTFPETFPSIGETLKIKDPKEIERLARLLFDDSDTDSVQSIPLEGTCDTANTPQSNYYSPVAPHTTYSPSSTNVEEHLADTPSCRHAAATPPEGGDGIDPQGAASPCTSNTHGRSTPSFESVSSFSAFRSSQPSAESVLSPSAFHSTPFIDTESHENDESGRRQTWTMFKSLVYVLLAAQERGMVRPSRSTIAVELVQSDKQVYRRAGVSKFRDYTALAEQAGIIELGGREAGAWIALHPNWFGVGGVTPTPFFSSETSSSISDPPEAIQSPLLTCTKTPLIERATIFQSPSFTSPKFNSPERSGMFPTSPIDQQDGPFQDFIPTEFKPLIDVLMQLHAEGFHQPLRSVVGQLLGQDVYTRAGVSSFKVYAHQASEAQLVQFGGVGGHAWMRLHPELRI